MDEKRKTTNRKYHIVFGITYNCNIKCRHCCADTTGMDISDPSADDLKNWLTHLPPEHTEVVYFGGGEPFLKYNNLKEYCGILNKSGIVSGSLTNGYWGQNKEKARELLKGLPGLKNILISVDKYHQEFIDKEIIFSAIEVALESDKSVYLAATHENDEELKIEQKKYIKYFPRVMVVSSKMMTTGGAQNLEIEKYTLRNEPQKFNSFCAIGTLYVNHFGSVYMCCVTGTQLDDRYNPFFLGNIDKDGWQKIFEKANNSAMLRAITKEGPISVVDAFKGTEFYEELLDEKFYSECDICFSLFKKPETLSHLAEHFKTGAETLKL